MASAKRKQDEKNLKLLRELVSLPVNKECFDCRQRGPTYVNMTIGSFVCTSCSGILRGLTPPHRVKSISMATFTPEEIELVKERGNEHCRNIWLGLADTPALKIQDSKDEQRMKDLMISKYELKRFYLDPSVAGRSKAQKSTQNNSRSDQSAIPRVPQPGTTPSTSTSPSPSTWKTKNQDPVDSNAFDADFVADFGKISDPFSAAAPTPTLRFDQSFTPQPSFANFDNNPVFNSAKSNSSSSSFFDDATGQSFANFNGVDKPPSEDRYAALKDLDSLMKQTQLKEEPVVPQTTSTWDPNNSSGQQQNWTSNNQTTNVISNPFAGRETAAWQSGTNFTNGNNSNNSNNNNNNNNNNNQMQSSDNNTSISANPFRTMQLPSDNEHQWFGVGLPGNGDIVTSSQMMTQFSSKAWQPVNSYHANPFMVGSGVGTTTRNTNNPFL